MDRYEVTNREYKAFVDAGGYGNRTLLDRAFPERPGGGCVGGRDGLVQGRDRPPGRIRGVSARIPTGRLITRSAASKVRGSRICPVRREGASDDRTLGAGTALLSVGQLDYRAAQQLRKLRSEAGKDRRPERVRVADIVGNVREWCFNEVGPAAPRGRGVDGRYIPCRMDHPEGSIRSRRHAWIPLVRTFDDAAALGRLRQPVRRPSCGTIARKSPWRSPNSHLPAALRIRESPAQSRGGGDR